VELPARQYSEVIERWQEELCAAFLESEDRRPDD